MSRVIESPTGLRHVGGRRRPKETLESHPHLFRALQGYVKAKLPDPPEVVDYITGAKAALSDILGNDTLGDCTAAGVCHIIEAVTAAAGAPVTLTRADAVKFYSLSTGYVPGEDWTDQGGDEVTVCNVLKAKGIDGKGAHAIKGWLAVDAKDATLIKQCVYVFGNAYFGAELADAWTQVQGDGFVWDVGQGEPDPENGHCFAGLGANDRGVQVDSWGLEGTITYPAIAKFCSDHAGGNVFILLTDEIINKAKGLCPAGIDWVQLEADFAAVAQAA